MNLDFSDIAPYRDKDVPEAIKALMKEYSFMKVLRYVYPEKDDEQLIEMCEGIRTVKDFQAQVAYRSMLLMNHGTITALTHSGMEHVKDTGSHLYISNHRDIILDSALLNMLLHEQGMDTTETAIGSNLLENPTVKHLTKLNKNFTVNRNVSGREQYESSLKLSHYIRHSITERGSSIWISQREGRAKDGNDRTQQGLLKMLQISSKNKPYESFKDLNILPMALSYEYDPCDVFKVRELLFKAKGENYEKGRHEDLQNIIAGITQQKGRVHLAIGTPLSDSLNILKQEASVNDLLQEFAKAIDKRIHKLSRLWPNNYVAYDLLHGRQKFTEHYREDDVEEFVAYCKTVLSDVRDDNGGRKILLQKYAFPLENFLEASHS
ncbi:MAG: glycerol acyltransferase [Flavobacteriales bacterium]|nr:glycerol acyltransferase [Flavobacteriales bacterium]NNK81129.1 glycerol acyltransferase [Flavobacteriales bacterium]